MTADKYRTRPPARKAYASERMLNDEVERFAVGGSLRSRFEEHYILGKSRRTERIPNQNLVSVMILLNGYFGLQIGRSILKIKCFQVLRYLPAVFVAGSFLVRPARNDLDLI